VVETTTKNYGWIKPEIQHSPATWGGFLNNDLDAIDALVFANQEGINPIGSGALWFTATPPANWLICNGASLDTTAYAGLFAVFGYAFGGSGANFNLPDLRSRFPMGAGTLAATGGEAAHTLTAAELASHAHPITDIAHTHSAYQSPHNHGITTGGHSHTIFTGAHTHTVPNNVVVGSGSGLTNGGASFSLQGNPTTSTAGNLGGNTDTAGNLGGITDTQAPGVGINAAGTGLSTTVSVGSGAAHNNLPPFLTINFIVRYQ
jgi:microcystin-dependent protein